METVTVFADTHAIWMIALASGLVAATVNTLVLAALTFGMGILQAEGGSAKKDGTPRRRVRKVEKASSDKKIATKRHTLKGSAESAITPVVSISDVKTRVLKGVL